MSAMASQITGVSIVCSIICWGTDQRKHQRSTSLTFVRGIHQWQVDSPHKGPVTRKMFPFDYVVMDSVWMWWKMPLQGDEILLTKIHVWEIFKRVTQIIQANSNTFPEPMRYQWGPGLVILWEMWYQSVTCVFENYSLKITATSPRRQF